jgi:hypothetical protein
VKPFSFGAPVFQPARRADWKVGFTAAQFMERIHRNICSRLEPMNCPLTRPGGHLFPAEGERDGVRGVRFMGRGNEANSNPQAHEDSRNCPTSRAPRQSRGFPNLIMKGDTNPRTVT